MKKAFLALCFFGFLSAKCQQVVFINQYNTALEKTLYIDRFLNRYGLIKNQFLSEDENQNKLFFSELLYSNPTIVDAKNPLRVLLFYADFQVAVLTDNQMNSTEEIDFKIIPQVQVSWVAMATQNQLWIYDELSQRFGLYSLQHKKIKWQTTPVLKPKQFYPNYNSIYFLGPTNVLYKVNQNGSQIELGTLPRLDKMKVIDDTNVLFLYNKVLYFYNLNTKKQTELILNNKSIQDFFINDDILSIFTKLKITNYKLTSF